MPVGLPAASSPLAVTCSPPFGAAAIVMVLLFGNGPGAYFDFDSFEMTDADRAIVVEQCRQAAEPRILITHGTDTMIETAAALAAALPASTGKTIVLTGAMIPYAFGSSDGLFNLGSALSFVQVLPAGIYIAMNGKCFAWDRVRKNRAAGVFEEV